MSFYLSKGNRQQRKTISIIIISYWGLKYNRTILIFNLQCGSFRAVIHKLFLRRIITVYFCFRFINLFEFICLTVSTVCHDIQIIFNNTICILCRYYKYWKICIHMFRLHIIISWNVFTEIKFTYINFGINILCIACTCMIFPDFFCF